MDIHRRGFLTLTGPIALTSAVGLMSAIAEAKPSFIVVMSDDCSAREFGCYGHKEHRTPNIDRLAREGVMFDTCWCTPICSPTPGQMMTGKYGFRTRWFHNKLKDGATPLSKNRLTFSQLLKQQGYATAVCGKCQFPKSVKLNVGGYRSKPRPGWFAWINKGRESFRPKNQGPLELE